MTNYFFCTTLQFTESGTIAAPCLCFLDYIFSSYTSFPLGWALSLCNKPEETGICACCTHRPICTKPVFFTCQLWLYLIRHSCFLIIPVVQRRSDLNMSATGTVAPLHLLIAIVSPWKVFQIMAVVFSWQGGEHGECVDGFHSTSEMGVECLWNVLKKTNTSRKQMEKKEGELTWRDTKIGSSPGVFSLCFSINVSLSQEKQWF